MAQNKVNVTINSRMYTVVSEESEEYIKALGDHINEKINFVLRGGKNIIGERPLVLAALNICDEYFKVIEAGNVMTKQTKDTNDKLKETSAQLQKRIEKNKELADEIARLDNEAKAMSNMNNKLKNETAAQKKEIESLKDEVTSLLKENRRLNGTVKR